MTFGSQQVLKNFGEYGKSKRDMTQLAERIDEDVVIDQVLPNSL